MTFLKDNMRSSVFGLRSSNTNKTFLLTILCMLIGLNTVLAQFKIPKKPDFQTSVYDFSNLLSASEKSNLEEKLIKYSDTTSTQIVIAVINSTEEEDINFLGAQWGQEWGIGQAKEDNGILILLAKDDRKIAINTGYGVEHLLTDALSKRIIEGNIIPYFKQGDYYGGLNKGADAIFQVLTGEYQDSRKSNNDNGFPVGLIFVIIFIIILISISNNKRSGGGGNRGNKSGGFDIWDAIILSNMGRGSFGGGSGGFGGGSSGGGGFGGGFGGGGFGGGGASGGW